MTPETIVATLTPVATAIGTVVMAASALGIIFAFMVLIHGIARAISRVRFDYRSAKYNAATNAFPWYVRRFFSAAYRYTVEYQIAPVYSRHGQWSGIGNWMIYGRNGKESIQSRHFKAIHLY